MAQQMGSTIYIKAGKVRKVEEYTLHKGRNIRLFYVELAEDGKYHSQLGDGSIYKCRLLQRALAYAGFLITPTGKEIIRMFTLKRPTVAGLKEKFPDYTVVELP